MKPRRRLSAARLSFPLASALAALFNMVASSAFAANLYWDTNGTGTAGSGAATGTWGTSVFWSTDSTGANVGSPVLTATTTGVDDLFFSAGTDGTGGIVTVGTSQTARKLTFEEGALTLSGGTMVTLAGGGGITVLTGAGNATISTALTLNGNNTFNVGASRTLTLNTGAFNRGTRATLNVQGAGTVTSTKAGLATGGMVNGIIGPWASFGTGTSTRYATFTGNNITALTGTTRATPSAVISTAGTENTELTGVGTSPTTFLFGAGASINTLRYSGAAGSIGTNTLLTKGVMNAGTGTLTFTGALSAGAAGNEMVINTASADIAMSTATGLLTGTITKTGSGTFTLGNGANHAIGAMTVNEGVLVTGATAGDTLTGATINSGGTLRFGSGGKHSNSAAFTINAGGTLDVQNFDDLIGSISGAGTVTNSNAGTTSRIQFGANTAGFTGNITGTGMKVLVREAATYTISTGATSNTYTGTTTAGSGGTSGFLTLANTNPFGTTPGTNTTSAIVLNNGVLTAAAGSGTNTTIAVPITLTTGQDATLRIGSGAASTTTTFTLNGAIGGATNNLVFTTTTSSFSNGSSVFVLGAASTYTGNTTITTGSGGNNPVFVRNGITNALPLTTVLSFGQVVGGGSGRTFQYDLNGFNQTLAGLDNGGLVPEVRRMVVTSATPATLTINNTANYTFGGATISTTVGTIGSLTSAQITGAIALTKSGAGTFTLGGTLAGGATDASHTYTGATTVTEGTLAIASTSGLANTAISATNAGSTFAVTPLAAETVNLGNTGTVGAGASLNLGSGTIFSMVDGTAGGTTNLVQEATFAANALTLNGASLNFEVGAATADKLAVTLAASVSGTNLINVAGVTALGGGPYDLITAASGLAGAYAFGGSGTTTQTVAVGTNAYPLTLSNSATAVTVTVGAPTVITSGGLTWSGQTNGTGATNSSWDNGISNNWAANATASTYSNGTAVSFNDTNAANGNAAITNSAVAVAAGGVTPTSTAFDNTAVNYTVSNASGVIGIAGTGALTKVGSGTVTLSGLNSFSGNVTISGGTLVANVAGSGGNSALGGSLSAKTITVNTGGTLRADVGNIFNNNFASLSTQLPALAIAGGTLTNGGAATNSALGDITLTSGTLTATTGAPAGTASGQGYGSWNLNGTVASTGTSFISSSAAGSIPITLNATSGTSSPATIFDVTSGTLTVSAVLGQVTRSGSETIGSLTKTGGGTMVLSGTNTYAGATTVSAGTLIVSGTGTLGVPGAVVTGVGTTAGSTGTLVIHSSSATALNMGTGSSSFYIGQNTTGTSAGVLYLAPGMGGTGTVTQASTSADINIGWANGATGNAVGTIYQSAGTFTQTSGSARAFYLGLVTTAGGVGTGTYNIDGGTLSTNSKFYLSGTNNSTNTFATGSVSGTLNISGTGVVTATGTFQPLLAGAAAAITKSATINLNSFGGNSGVLQTAAWTGASTGNATLNFNGGTLKFGATGSSTFLSATTSAVNIYANGAIIDTNGNSNTITQAFQNAADNGLASVSISGTSATYTTPPTVTFGGATGILPTGYGVLDSSGAITGIVVTNGGSYTGTLTASIDGSGLTLTPASAANNTGGLTVKGGGSLQLGAVASTSWTGGLIIEAGNVIGGFNANTFGADANVITLGHTSGSANTQLTAYNSATYLQPITVKGGNSGVATLMLSTAGGNPIWGGAITLDTHDLTIAKTGTASVAQVTGGITGTGNLTIDNDSTTSTITLATGAINQIGSISNIGSATGTTTISAAIGSNVTDVIQNSTTSGMTLSNASIAYTGATTVSAGTLNITGGTTAPLTTNALTVAGGATLALVNTVGQRVDLSGAINLGAGAGTSTLNLELGNTVGNAYDSFNSAVGATTAGTVQFNITNVGMVAGTYNLLQATGGLNSATYTLGSMPGGFSYAQASSATSVDLTTTVLSGDLYWRGAVNNSWASYNGVNSNFTTDAAGLLNANGTPGALNNVIFSATSASGPAIATTLDGNVVLNRLNVIAAPSGVTSVVVAPGTPSTSSLTITPTLATDGIAVASNAGAVTISAPVVLGASQTWSVDGTGANGSSLTVSGAITGSGANSLAITGGGTGVVTLSGGAGLSTYSGTTTVPDSAILQGGATNSFSANSAMTVNGTGSLRLNGFNNTVASLAGNGTVQNNHASTAATLTVGNASNTDFSGILQNGSTGPLGLTKVGSGALTLSGTSNIHTGNTTVSAGTLNITGSWTGSTTTSTLALGGTAGKTVTNVSGDITAFGFTGGAVSGAVAVYNQTAGLASFTGSTGTTTINVASASGSYGYLNLTGGTFKVANRFGIGGNGNTAIQATGITYVGGTGFLDMTNSEWALNYSHGHVTVAGSGVIDRSGATQPYGIIMNSTVSGGQYGVLNVAGGSFLTTTMPIRYGNGNASNNTALINLAAGTLQVGTAMTVNLGTGSGNNAYLNFAGGTLKTSAAVTNWIPTAPSGITFTPNLFGAIDNSALSGAPSFAGGLIFDSNGFDSSLGTVLRGATGSGVAQSSLTVTGGTGYIGAPEVVFTGGTLVAGGTPAAGYALISGGVVTGIVITSPGTYSVAPAVSLVGGGGTDASIAMGALVTNTSGGLTKTGSGNLTLSAANTFTGGTTVNQGGLILGINDALASAGAITVNGGSLDLATFTNSAATVSLQSGGITGSTGVLTSGAAYDLRSGTVNFTGTGGLAGSVGLNKTTGGTVTLSGASSVNSFTGPVSVTAGTLAFATSNHLGDAASLTNTLAVSGGSTLQFTNPGSVNLGANQVLTIGAGGATLDATQSTGVLTLPSIAGASTGNLTKTGVGSVVIGTTTSLDSGAGSATISDGKLTASFGTGGINNLTVGATGNMSFQNGTAEILTLSSGVLTLGNGSRLGFDLGAPGTNDQILTSTAASVPGSSTITLDFSNLGGIATGSYNLITATGGLNNATYVLGSGITGWKLVPNATSTLVSLGVTPFTPTYWRGGVSGSWNTLGTDPFNWTTDSSGTIGDTATPGTADTVVFSALGAPFSSGSEITTTLDAAFTIDSLVFNNVPATISAVTINGGTGGTLTLAPTSTVDGIDVQANAGTITLNAPLTAFTAQRWTVSNVGAGTELVVGSDTTFTAAVTKSGLGTLTLSGTNGGAGGFSLAAGTLKLASNNALGTGTFTVAPGTTLDATGSTRTLNNGANAWNGNFTFTGSNNLDLGAGGVILGGNVLLTASASTLTVGGGIDDGAATFGLTKSGNGALVLNGANGYDGLTNLTAGTLTLAGNNSGASGGVTMAATTTLNLNSNNALGTGTFTINGGTLDATVAGVTDAGATAQTWNSNISFTGTNSLNLGTGTVTLGLSPTITTSGAATTLTVGQISDGASVFGISKAGPGTLSVSGTSTYKGPTAISAGTLIFTGSLTGGGAISTSSTGILTQSSGGVISGAASITQGSSGTSTLAGANTYTGATTIDNGTLAFTANQNFSAATNTLLFGSTAANATPGILDLDSANATFGGALTVNTNSTTASQINIGSGKTLTLNGNVQIGATTPTVPAVTKLIIGGGGNLLVSNTGGTFQVGGSTTVITGNPGNDSTLDLTGLQSTEINLGATGTVRVNNPQGGNTVGVQASLLLPTPVVALNTPVATITALNFNVGDAGGNGNGAGQINSVTLGTGLTTLNVNTVNVGTGNRDFGQIIYVPGNGTVKLRAADGTSRAAFNLGTGTANTGVAPGTGVTNSVDLAGHSADLMISTLTIGGQNRNTNRTDTFAFDTGSFDATTVVVGTVNGTANTTSASSTWTSTLNLGGGNVDIGTGGLDIATRSTATTGTDVLNGTVNISGGTVDILNNTTFGAAVRLGQNSTATGVTANGLLNITGGTVTLVGNIIKGATTGAGSATVTLDGASAVLDMGGFNIGAASPTVTFNAFQGTLRNLSELNGGGALTKSTGGTLILSGTNTYTGATTVSQGTLLINGDQSAATGLVTVAAGAKLGGIGTIGGLTTVNGTLAIGTSPGTMTFNSDLGLNVGSISDFEINSFTMGEFDLAKAATAGTQTVTFGGGTLNLLFQSGFSTEGSVKIFDFDTYAGTGFTTVNPTGLADGYTASFEPTTGMITVIPEPRAALLGGLGLLALLRRRRTNHQS